MNIYKFLLALFLNLAFFHAGAQSDKGSSIGSPEAYFGQNLPGLVPEEFGATFLKVDGMAYQNSSFSPDGKEFMFGVFDETTEFYTLYFSRFENGRWTAPEKAPFLGSLNDKLSYEPRHHPEGNILYLTGEGELYYSLKENGEWTTVQKMKDPINQPNTEHASLDKHGTLYFWSRREGEDDLYRSEPENGQYNTMENLGYPVNSPAFDGDPYVDVDGQYLIFTSNRGMSTATTEGTWMGNGGTDLYITYWKSGRWTNPKHLGPEINKPDVWNYNPMVTPDGKYFIFGRRKIGEGRFSKLYWVSTEFIDSLKQTNFEPYLNIPIDNKTLHVGQLFSFKIPEEIFIDDDGNHTLSYRASLSDGSPLPSWLQFDSASRTFSGIPPEKEAYSLRLTAIDAEQLRVSSNVFRLQVEQP